MMQTCSVRVPRVVGTAIGVGLLGLAALFATGDQAHAQDQFGRAVSVVGTDVLVAKPLAGQGPATVYVFQRGSDGAWTLAEELVVPAGFGDGQVFSPTLSAGDGLVLVASGDPEAEFGAHAFSETGAGGFSYAGRLPLERGPRPPSAGASIDMGTVMRILQPPARIVATDGAKAAVSLVGSGVGQPGVRVLERAGGSESWTIQVELSAPEGQANSGFGSSLAIQGDLLLVGAPGLDGRGAALVYRRESASEWGLESTLSAEDFPPGSRMGETVLLTGGMALVSAPRNRTGATVLVYAPTGPMGAWEEQQRLVSPRTDGRDLFGFALATDGEELWVAAPRADESRGAVHRYLLDPGTESWAAAGMVPSPLTEPGFALGMSIAIGEDIAVVGAPGADGSRGRAAVYARSSGTWTSEGWVQAGENLDRIAGEEVRCTDGEAGGFRCEDVDLLAFLPISAIGGEPGESVSDVWGWTDPETEREYSLVGRNGGAAIVDVTDPSGPRYLGVVEANPSGARDLKVYQDHLFFTGDGAGEHGLVIFDLTRLRDVETRGREQAPETFQPDTIYDGIASAHNLVLDPGSGFAFPVGASGGGETCGGGLHMVDVRDPVNPKFAGCYTDTHGLIAPGRTHDAQCTVYSGPDEAYRGREICFVSNETALRVVDVTDKANPVPISAASYPGMAYVHQGWLTEDQRYFYLDDELDELVGETERTRTFIWDVSELDDPVMVGHFDGPDGATDHNLYVKGDRMYQANYQAGMRVIDISDPENPVEVGFFDTTPYNGNPPGFNGAWTAYPYFESGTVVVSSIHEGLFLLRPRRRALIP